MGVGIGHHYLRPLEVRGTGVQETHILIPVLQGGHMLDEKKADLGIKETKAQILALSTPS